MKTVHSFIWGKSSGISGECNLDYQTANLIDRYLYLLSGLDNEIRDYLMKYLLTHTEFDMTEIHMMYDYLSSSDEVLQN